MSYDTMDPGNNFREELANDDLAKTEDLLAKAKLELASIRRDNKQKSIELAQIRETMDMIQKIEAEHTKPPPWASPDRQHKSHAATLSLLLSDMHFDEVIDPAEVEGLGCYNREIAEARLQRCVEKTIMLSRDYLAGVQYDGLSLMLGGDGLSGFIHEELVETNECPVPESVLHWLDPLSAAIGTFADHYGHVHVSGVVGNHPRMSRKPRAKRRVTDNLDWLIYRLLMRDFKNDDRVTWQIPYSADTTVTLYDTDFLFTHGDQFRGGGGIAGVLSPLMTGAYRKSKRGMQTGRTFDYIVMGHWHQLGFFKNIIVNGSLKGYDEYAYISNFEYEPPQQGMWVTTPENGVTFTAPVLVEDRKSESW